MGEPSKLAFLCAMLTLFKQPAASRIIQWANLNSLVLFAAELRLLGSSLATANVYGIGRSTSGAEIGLFRYMGQNLSDLTNSNHSQPTILPANEPDHLMTLYEELVAAGCVIDHHESDLYVKCSDKAETIIVYHCLLPNSIWTYSQFRSNIDGSLWYEVPFAYDPFWKQPAR